MTSVRTSSVNYPYTVAALLCSLAIVYLSSIPSQSLWGGGSAGEQIAANLAHIPAYALLTFLWLKAFDRVHAGGRLQRAHIVIGIGVVLFALSDEYHQSFIPGRSASFIDIGLDFIGIVFGIGVWKIWGKLG